MHHVRTVILGGVVALLVGLSSITPVSAQREIPTGAARIVEKVQFEALVGTIQIQSHVDQILENNAGVIPGK
jgi:hypothetical protein